MRIIHLACAVLLAAGAARPATAQTEAERVVQAHHDAYNRRDAVALLAVYAPDAVIVAHPADTMHRGAVEIREYYKQIFQLLPRLRVEVRAHQAEGNTVVDELLYTGWPCGGTFSERAVFEVQDGRILSITNTTIDDGVEAMMISGAGTICFPATDTAGKATP